MTNLTRIAIMARRVVRYGIYFIIFLIVGRIVFNIGVGIYNMLFPKPPPVPTVTYGKLPKLPFPDKPNIPKLTYTVQTATGELPTFADQAKVYFIPRFVSGFNSLDDAKEKAANLGYPKNPTKKTDTIYQFSDTNGFSVLEMNTVSKLFSISYNLTLDQAPLSSRPPAPEIARPAMESLLGGAGLFPADLSGPSTNAFLKVDDGKIVPALSLSDSNFVKINLYRKDYDELPSVTTIPDEANVWFLFGGGQRIVAAQYHYFPVDEQQSSTYPIKTTQEAVDELMGGGGFVAALGLNADGNVVLRKIYLAYYDSGRDQNFYQPIYVFEGDKGFIAYLPAVTASYYGE